LHIFRAKILKLKGNIFSVNSGRVNLFFKTKISTAQPFLKMAGEQ